MTEVIYQQSQENRCKRLRNLLKKINLFNEQEDLSLVDQLLSTRIFLLSLTTSLCIITFFGAVSVQTHSKTVESPSEALFNDLSLHYRTTLLCPCQQTSIAQNNFISFNPHYHPICSSQLTNSSFISLFLFDPNMSEYWPLDHRVMLASHFQMLALFCQSIQQTISSKLNEFATKQIVNNHLLFRDVFESQVLALFQQIKTNLITDNQYLRETVWFAIATNRILSSLRTNFVIETDPNAGGSLYMGPMVYADVNRSCACNSLDVCVHKASFYNSTGRNGMNLYTIFGDSATDPPVLFSIPGMLAGCLPYNPLLKSTLECLFDQVCIERFRTIIDHLPMITPLVSSHFAPNTTTDNLLNELLIESWNEHSNFTNYYQVCSPSICTYSYDQRFSLVFIISILISLFGGLKTIIYLLSPLIVKILRQIQNKHSSSTTRSKRERCIEFINGIYQKIRTLNLFSHSSDIQNEIYSTRLYILFLTIGIIILVVYVSISVHIRTMTVFKPSIDQYEQLFARYPSTLICPCSQFSIFHSEIVTIQPYYHQICSKIFIREFLTFYKQVTLPGAVHSFDFRLHFLSWFATLDMLCQATNATLSKQLTAFNQTQFVSSQVLAKDIFQSQMNTLIEQFQNQTMLSFRQLFQLLRNAIQLNQFYTNGNANAKLTGIVSSNMLFWRLSSTNDYDNQCSCGTNSSCRRPQGFYCRSASCSALTTKPNQTIPGLFISCLSMDSVLISSLECFYNASCIQMLCDWLLFDFPNLTINTSTAANITPLDSSVNSRFPVNMTVDEIASQLFIENWTDSVSFIDYYRHCAPTECTYTFNERFNLLYLISIILGVIGGLSVALRIIIPLFVKFHCQYSNNWQIILHIRRLNFYRTKLNNEQTDILLIHRQQKATRFYVLAFCLAMIVILIFINLNRQIRSKNVSFPTESTFELLKSQYPSTISCPCSQIAIPYSQFISLNVSAYHQICSSDFVSSDVIKRIWGTDTTVGYIWYLDAKVLSAQLRALSSLCTLAKNAIDQKIDIFYSQKLITIEPLTRFSFQTQVNSIIQNFINQTPQDFQQTLNFIIGMLHANQLQNTLFTNWILMTSYTANGYSISTRSRLYNESGEMCSCATSSTCTRSTFQIRLIDKTVDGIRENKNDFYIISISLGIVFGCLPIYGLRFSSLRCFYNSTCLKILTDSIEINDTLTPLNNSLSSISIGTLIDELFIETWTNSSNYSSYYSICAPLTCRYSYSERNSPLYIITTILGLYGGLTVGLKSVIWYILFIYWKICQHIRNRVECDH